MQFYPTYGKATGAIVTQSHFAAQAEARKLIKKVAADEPGLGLRPEKLAAARTEVRGSRMAGYYEVTATEAYDEDAWAAVQISLRAAGFELVRAAEEMVEAEWMWAVPAGDPRIGAMLAALWRAGVGPVAVIDRAHGFDLMPAARRGGRSNDGGPPRPEHSVLVFDATAEELEAVKLGAAEADAVAGVGQLACAGTSSSRAFAMAYRCPGAPRRASTQHPGPRPQAPTPDTPPIEYQPRAPKVAMHRL